MSDLHPFDGAMQEALALAAEAARAGEVPVGAVAVHEGRVVGRGRNRREEDRDPCAHAEMLALHEASRTTLVDGWSSYLTYGTTPERADYVVRSAGADGALESTPLWGLTTNFNSDIILVDGGFTTGATKAIV